MDKTHDDTNKDLFHILIFAVSCELNMVTQLTCSLICNILVTSSELRSGILAEIVLETVAVVCNVDHTYHQLVHIILVNLKY